jgi:hypothetical protein
LRSYHALRKKAEEKADEEAQAQEETEEDEAQEQVVSRKLIFPINQFFIYNEISKPNK